MKRKNPETSKEAYNSLDSDNLRDMYRDIIQALNVLGSGTFEDIAAYLRVEKSKVWKRLSEMSRMNLIYRPGGKKLLKSGRNGFLWALTNGSLIKTELEAGNVFKKKVKSATDYANDIIKATAKEFKQGDLF